MENKKHSTDFSLKSMEHYVRLSPFC